jgi:hypothetical protein
MPPTDPPAIGEDSSRVLEHAVASLGTLRDLDWLGDATATIHLLASIITQAEHDLPGAIDLARQQDHTWFDIAQALGTSVGVARRRRTMARRRLHTS